MDFLIIDTNIILTGLMSDDPGSLCSKILLKMTEGGLPYLLSDSLLDEYRRKADHEKIRTRIGLTDEELLEVMDQVRKQGTMVTPHSYGLSPDPADNHVWDILLDREDAILLTYDKRLIKSPPEGRVVITPGDYFRDA